ncbi:MAG TPA: hypothetical protein VH044_17135 [Polyangiaceae bacterium]|nr:hypothetical protein [Polyangiaceae bacterium]
MGGAAALAILGALVTGCGDDGAGVSASWPQWGQSAQHAGAVLTIIGQPLRTVERDYVYDPLVTTEIADSAGALTVHYMTPLTQGSAVYMETKAGAYSPAAYATQAWSVVALSWVNGALVRQWQAGSDWKAPGGSADFWEPVFHGALANGMLYVPGAKGTLVALDEKTGATVSRITPDASWDANTYAASPVTADTVGNLYFTVLRLPAPGPAVMLSPDQIAGSNSPGGAWTTPAASTFYGSDALDSFLVRVDSHGGIEFVSVARLVPDAPRPLDACETTFANAQLPWPPGVLSTPPTTACGTQRVALNAAPAVAPDGTIYLITRAHFSSRYAYLVAARPDLTPKWDASLRDRFADGCGVPRALGGQLEPNGAPGGCAVGANYGVDPATNRPGGGNVLDDASSSPVVAPDGSVFYGAATSYNYSQGHLMHFDASGAYLGAYPFGWDTTPAIRVHDGTYSLVTKENHYGDVGSYCSDETYCPADRNTSAPDYPEGYFVTQLSPGLKPEWQYRATNQQTCSRDATGAIACVTDHPSSFEWCVNAPAIDEQGTVFVNSEDGWLYAIAQGGTVRDKIFLQAHATSAYAPVSLDSAGRVYAQDAGHMFVVGAEAVRP